MLSSAIRKRIIDSTKETYWLKQEKSYYAWGAIVTQFEDGGTMRVVYFWENAGTLVQTEADKWLTYFESRHFKQVPKAEFTAHLL